MRAKSLRTVVTVTNASIVLISVGAVAVSLIACICCPGVVLGGEISLAASGRTNNEKKIEIHLWDKFSAAELVKIKTALNESEKFCVFASTASHPAIFVERIKKPQIRIDLYGISKDMTIMSRWETLILHTDTGSLYVAGDGQQAASLDQKTNAVIHYWGTPVNE